MLSSGGILDRSHDDTRPSTADKPLSRINSSKEEGPTKTKTPKQSKKKGVTPLSIEEIFGQVSSVSAGILNPPLKPCVLTPRSAQVCLRLGVNPELLKIRDLDSFWEQGVDSAVQRMRHEAYVQRRHDLMKQCRRERKLIMSGEYLSDADQNSSSKLPITNQGSSKSQKLTSEMILQQEKEQTSTLIKMELQRLEKIQRRQEKELEQMIQFEVNRARIQEEMAKKLEDEKRREQQQRRRQEKRLRLLTEERRLRELQKNAIEQSEEEKRNNLAREMYEKERQIAEEAKRKQEELKEKLRQEESEKKHIHDEHRRQLQQYFENEKIRLRKRLESMQEAERKKQEALATRQRELAEKCRIKREQAEKRIEDNIQLSKSYEEKRKQDFLNKQQSFERKREEHLKRLEEERLYQQQENYLQEQRRQMILMEQKKLEEERAQSLLNKLHDDDVHVAIVHQTRGKETELMREKKLIKLELKKENVQRVSRVKEYEKLVVLKKIEDTDGRVKTMLEQRRMLIAERRKAAAETKRQKELLTKAMEEIRSNATKASHFVEDALSGRMSIHDIARGDMSVLTHSPSKTSTHNGSNSKEKMRKSTTATTSQLLGLQGKQRLSKSEGFDNGKKSGLNWDDQMMLDAAMGTSKLKQNKSFITQNEIDPAPYISPYELPLDQTKSATADK